MKRIAFFAFETRKLNTYPYITNSAFILAKKGYLVDIFLSSQMVSNLKIKGVKVIQISDNNAYEYIIRTIKYIKKNRIKYNFCLSYFIEGLIIADILNWSIKLPTIYFSMELIYNNFLTKLIRGFTIRSGNTKLSLIKLISWIHLQLFGKRFIQFSIIQDKKRGEFLKKEFQFVDKILYLPNSYIGFSKIKSDSAYIKFGIPKNKNIILYTGGFEKGFDLSLINISKILKRDYVLFLNVYSRDNYISKIKDIYQNEINNKFLFINDVNLNETDYDLLVKSSHICLGWYFKPNKNDHNMYYLGLSSGKICKYLSCGKPVIAPNYCYDYKSFIEDNNLGITCSKASEILNKIIYIENNYLSITKSISNFYKNNLEFKKQFIPILKLIKSI